MTNASKARKPLVGVLTGSPSDLPTVEKVKETLDQLSVTCEVRVLSAHRTPDLVLEYVKEAEATGVEVT